MKTLKKAQTPKGRYSIQLQKEENGKYAVRAYNGKSCTHGCVGMQSLRAANKIFDDMVENWKHNLKII